MSGEQQQAAVRYRYYPAAAGTLDSSWLAVGGFGVAVENMLAPTLWHGMKAAKGRYVPSPDAPFGSLRACEDMADTFRGAVLRRTLRHWSRDGRQLQHFVENYPVPGYFFMPARRDRRLEFQAAVDQQIERIQYAVHSIAGMPFHDIASKESVAMAADVDTRNIWRKIVARFDEAGDLTCHLLYAEDGYAVRSRFGGWENDRNESLRSILSRPKSAADLSESFASVLLMRPKAAQWLRELAVHVVDSRELPFTVNGTRMLAPHGFGGIHGGSGWLGGREYCSPHSYQSTTRFVAQPWCEAQMEQYDSMPTYGWLYRPQVVDYAESGEGGEPATDQRTQRLQDGIQGLIEKAFAGEAPARVFYFSGSGEVAAGRGALLFSALARVAPRLQMHDPAVGCNLSHCLGDLGVASTFAGLGLAAFCSWEEGGNSLVVDLREDTGATVLGFKSSGKDYWQQFKRAPFHDI